jgi:hypothetical protein
MKLTYDDNRRAEREVDPQAFLRELADLNNNGIPYILRFKFDDGSELCGAAFHPEWKKPRPLKIEVWKDDKPVCGDFRWPLLERVESVEVVIHG